MGIGEAWEDADREYPAGMMVAPLNQRAPHEAPGAREVFANDLSLWLNTRVR